MKNTKVCPRRIVEYESLEQMLGDVDRLVAARATTTGNWTIAQILEHLATAIDKSVDGFGFRASWHMRLMAKLMKPRFLRKKMPAGFKLPPRAAKVLEPNEEDLAAAQEHIHSAVGRFHAATKLQPHPWLGNLSRAEYNLLHLRHCELHMSFIANP